MKRPNLKFGDFTLDISERVLLRDGRPVPLTPKAFDLLVVLVSRPGNLITKEELLKEVWPDSFVEESNLAYHVFALRRALGDAQSGDSGERYVETVPKRGYRWTAPLEPADVRNGAAGREPELPPKEPGALQPSTALPPEQGLLRRKAVLWFGTGACLAAVALALISYSRRPPLPEPSRVEISTGVRFTETSAFALSPDGRHIVFAGSGEDGIVRLWVRSLDGTEPRPLAGTEVTLGGLVPPMFWSPDSRFVAFDALGQLKKIDINGGSPQTICTLPGLAIGGSWHKNGVILVGHPQGGIYRCSASSGGAASAVTRLNASRQDSAHVFPSFLTDGRRFLFASVSRSAPEQSGIYVGDLDASPENAEPIRILAAGFGATYIPDGEADRGHILFLRDGTLFAQSFDPTRLELGAEARPVASPVGSFLDGAFFSASENGQLAFKAPHEISRLAWLDRRGNVVERVGEPGSYDWLALAPDGTRAVVVRNELRAAVDQDLWQIDLRSGAFSRLTFDPRLEDRPIWSQDGKRVVFTSSGGIGSLYEQPVVSEGGPLLLLETQEHKVPASVSPDGRFLLYTAENIGSSRGDIWALPLFGKRKPVPLIRRPFDQDQAQFSPDGRWLAYVSNESGRPEVLVRAFAPETGEETESVIVSQTGGSTPRWSPEGKELFYLTPDAAMMAVAVGPGASPRFGSATRLFQVPGIAPSFGVAQNGGRFLVLMPEAPSASTTLSLIFNWQRTLDQR